MEKQTQDVSKVIGDVKQKKIDHQWNTLLTEGEKAYPDYPTCQSRNSTDP